MPAPPDQRFLPITFSLIGGGAEVDLSLYIRPEDLTVTNPSRLNVTQTLGGAWLDDWGPGLSQITMNGNTGWRGFGLLSGVDNFLALKQVVFDEWHSRRASVVSQGTNPDVVQLTYTDALNQLTKRVAPQAFTLRRSRSRPLLYNFSIQLTVLGDATEPNADLDAITSALNNPLRWLAGAMGLSDAVLDAQFLLTQVVNTVGTIGASVTTFVNTGIGILNSIGTIANTVQGAFDGIASTILNVGQNFAFAAYNAFSALAADPTLTVQAALPLMQMASVWGGVACLIHNSFNAFPLYPTYAALVGASFCSSTGGGDPPSQYAPGSNPWADITPAAAPPVTVTPAATAAMNTLAQADPLSLVTTPPQTLAIGASMAAIAAGVTVA